MRVRLWQVAIALTNSPSRGISSLQSGAHRLPSARRRSRLHVKLDRLVAKLAACVFERRRRRDCRRLVVVGVVGNRRRLLVFVGHVAGARICEARAIEVETVFGQRARFVETHRKIRAP